MTRRSTLLVMMLSAVLVAAVIFAWRGGLDRLSGGPPTQFERRASLASCGTVDHRQITDGVPSEAVRCLEAAMRTGGGAELVVTGMTTEGDPLTSYYRAVPGEAGLEIYYDSTRDSYRSADWSYLRCPDARAANDLGECSSRDL